MSQRSGSENLDAAPLGSCNVMVNAAGGSDTGRKRADNQDQFMVATLDRTLQVLDSSIDLREANESGATAERALVLLVADGMGGLAEGERASAVAARSALRALRISMPWRATLAADEIEPAETALVSVVQSCHDAVKAADGGAKGRDAMGTTLTIAYVVWPHLLVVHSGDSRCYLYREGKLDQITVDHTVARQLIEDSEIQPDEIAGSRLENVLTQAVGGAGDKAPEPVVCRRTLVDGDAVLVCSDGLNSMVGAEEIAEVMERERYAAPRCRGLIEAANSAGGADNVTVVVASFEDCGPAKA